MTSNSTPHERSTSAALATTASMDASSLYAGMTRLTPGRPGRVGSGRCARLPRGITFISTSSGRRAGVRVSDDDMPLPQCQAEQAPQGILVVPLAAQERLPAAGQGGLPA